MRRSDAAGCQRQQHGRWWTSSCTPSRRRWLEVGHQSACMQGCPDGCVGVLGCARLCRDTGGRRRRVSCGVPVDAIARLMTRHPAQTKRASRCCRQCAPGCWPPCDSRLSLTARSSASIRSATTTACKSPVRCRPAVSAQDQQPHTSRRRTLPSRRHRWSRWSRPSWGCPPAQDGHASVPVRRRQRGRRSAAQQPPA